MSERIDVVGVPSEIKDNEKRVALTPDGVVELVHHGHQVVVQAGAGVGSRFPDDEYAAAGAKIVPTADDVFAAADLIVKVKEPVPAEYHRFRPGQQLFTYLHLAADRGLTEFLLERRIDSIAYETVQTPDRKLPLLTPDERGRRPDVRAGRRPPPGEPGRRRGDPARRRARHPGGEGPHHRRRGVRHRGREDRPRHAGHRPGPRHQPRPPGLPLRHLRRTARPGRRPTGPGPPPTSPRPTS